MKKRVTSKGKSKSKGKRSKTIKNQSAAPSIDVEQDIAGLLTALVQKLASFETKIDTVLARTMAQSVPAAPRPQSVPALLGRPSAPPVVERRRDTRLVHKAICADCHQDCEVPFKPSGNRPVYCRVCFAKRKSSGTFRPREGHSAKETTTVSITLPDNPTFHTPVNLSKKKKTVVKKKTGAKKKVSVKKKKVIKKKAVVKKKAVAKKKVSASKKKKISGKKKK